MASSAKGFQSRDAHKARMELEEARKAGTAPAELDEDGKEINPHIPEYMRSAPWYLKASEGSGLKHHKLQKEQTKTTEWYQRGKKVGPKVTKYRKGACENCGAMTHKKKDCVEKPRKKGAKYTGVDFKDDEMVQDIQLDFDGKRDQWNGYDGSMHAETIKRFEVMEKEREQVRKLKVEEAYAAGKTAEQEAEDEEGFKAAESEGVLGAKHSTGHQRGSQGAKMSVRNLRIREDTAKYLVNLDLGSAFYDPKTRSMRANPYIGTGKEGDELYMGDNFERVNGDAASFQKLQYHSLEAYEKGQDLHMESMPTQADKVHRDFKIKKEKLLSERQQQMLQQYGGAEHLNQVPKELLLAESETYIEYDRRGVVAGGLAKALPKTKYDEDIFEMGHTRCWGSSAKVVDGEILWGYGCCGQTTRYLPGDEACLKNPSLFFDQSRGSGVGTKRISAPAGKRAPSAPTPSPRALMPPPAAKGASTSPRDSTASSEGGGAVDLGGARSDGTGGAAKLMGAGDHGATEIHGREPFNRQHATYADEIAAAEEEKAERAAAGEKVQGEKRKMDYGEEIVGELDPKAVAKEAKRLKKAAKKAEKEQLVRKQKNKRVSTTSAVWLSLSGPYPLRTAIHASNDVLAVS
jgi:pre-mRNA-processing factor SLU7